MHYFLVQPWFTDPGHPAQSLVRTYCAIRLHINPIVFIYLPSNLKLCPVLQEFKEISSANCVTGSVWLQRSLGTLASGTYLTVRRLFQVTQKRNDSHIFFIDANLYVLSVALTIYRLNAKRVDVLCMVSPEFYQRSLVETWTKWRLIKHLFRLYNNFHLHLRTHELCESWHQALPEFKPRISYLPSLELQDSQFIEIDRCSQATPTQRHLRRFLILGQIRPQKSVEQVVSTFIKFPLLGTLKIAGRIADSNLRSNLMEFLQPHIEIEDQFLSIETIQRKFAETDYNLMLYLDWDNKMEASMLFESVRHGCPVVAYEGGWLGNTVANEKLGWLIPKSSRDNLGAVLDQLPSPNSQDYQRVLSSIKNCYFKWSSSSIVEEFLTGLNWKSI
jgi:glycosyltransferase involved in cell wall biosynthesis